MADHFSQRLQRAFKGKYECTGIPGALLYKERENFHKIRRTNTEKTSYFGNLAGMRGAASFSTKRGGADQKENFSGRGKRCAGRGGAKHCIGYMGISSEKIFIFQWYFFDKYILTCK